MLTIKHIPYSLNIIYALLFISIYINIHYILILKQTLHINIKTNTLHYKLTYKLYTLHINYTLDKYTIHFTYTLFILTIKHILYSLNIIYTLLFITIYINIHHILTIIIHYIIHYKLYIYTIHF